MPGLPCVTVILGVLSTPVQLYCGSRFHLGAYHAISTLGSIWGVFGRLQDIPTCEQNGKMWGHQCFLRRPYRSASCLKESTPQDGSLGHECSDLFGHGLMLCLFLHGCLAGQTGGQPVAAVSHSSSLAVPRVQFLLACRAQIYFVI